MPGYRRLLPRLLKEHVGEPLSGCEVGVWAGATSRILLRAFPNLFLWLVDHYKPYEPGKILPDLISQDRLSEALATVIKRTNPDRRCLIIADSSRAAKLIPGGLDFVFIDGCHKYEFVSSDLVSYYPLLHSGGLYCGHDYGCLHDRKGGFGVKRAVDEFAEQEGVKVESVQPQHVWWWVKP